MSIFTTAHIAMISDDFANMLRWHVLFLCIHETKLSFLSEPF